MQHLTVKFNHAQMQLLLKQGGEFIPDSHYARSLKATEEISVELLINHLQANYEFCAFLDMKDWLLY